MANTIDPTKPADGVDSVKADLRANLQAAADGISPADTLSAATAITVNAAAFGAHALARIRCSANAAVTVTLAADVPAGKAVQLVQYGSGIVTPVAGSGATLVKPASATYPTAAQYDAIVLEVDANVGGNAAAWRLDARS